MSKRKRTSKTPAGSEPQPAAGDATDDSAVKDDMVHVTPDVLAGSPDIWASKSGGSDAGEPEPVEPAEPVTAEPTEANTTLTPPADATATEPAPSAPPPPYVSSMAAPPPPQQRRAGSSAALGVVLVVLGVFALVIVLSGVDLAQYGWPLFVLVPGLTLLVIGFLGRGPGASIPGGIVTMLGLVLAYQNYSGDWPSWAFAWSLVAPFGVGLGMYLQALRDRDLVALKRGRTLMGIGALIFLFGFVFFESILGISGRDYGGFAKAALPLMLIVVGAILLVRSVQRSRRA
jgi:hypothetical protein